jgi:nitrogen fixation NifU-like protein
MERQHYIDTLLEHYEASPYRRAQPEADVVAQGSNLGCGDIITIYLNVDENNRAKEVWFEGEGCTISQASVSILLEQVQGKPLAEIEAISYNDLVETLGKDVVLTRVRCAVLGLKTLHEAIQQYHANPVKGG